MSSDKHRLTRDKVDRITAMNDLGATRAEIADAMDLPRSMVSRVILTTQSETRETPCDNLNRIAPTT